MCDLTTDSFKSTINSNSEVVVLFAPKTSVKGNALAKELQSRTNLPCFRVDVDAEPSLTLEFNIRRVPFLIRFKDGAAIAAHHTIDDVL